jgi:hypothetical protein
MRHLSLGAVSRYVVGDMGTVICGAKDPKTGVRCCLSEGHVDSHVGFSTVRPPDYPTKAVMFGPFGPEIEGPPQEVRL